MITVEEFTGLARANGRLANALAAVENQLAATQQELTRARARVAELEELTALQEPTAQT